MAIELHPKRAHFGTHRPSDMSQTDGPLDGPGFITADILRSRRIDRLLLFANIVMMVYKLLRVPFLAIVFAFIVCSAVGITASSSPLLFSDSRDLRLDKVIKNPDNYSSSSTLQNDEQRLRIDVECYTDGPPFALLAGRSHIELREDMHYIAALLMSRGSPSEPFVALSQRLRSHYFSLQALHGQESGLDLGDAERIIYTVRFWMIRNREITCSSIGIHAVDSQRLRAVGTGRITRVRD